jgi:hypothetical protein
MTGPSQAYYDAVAEGRRHHLSAKTYSGSFLRPHKPYLSPLIARLEIASALDIGAGKGKQYSWRDPADGKTLEEAWGFEVVKHDPCWPPYEAEPKGKFDLVLCTHTASIIPAGDLQWFMERIAGHAAKAVYVAEKIGPRVKQEIGDPQNRNIGQPPEFWIGTFDFFAAAYPALEWHLSLMVRETRGKITTRYIWRAGRFIESHEVVQEGAK